VYAWSSEAFYIITVYANGIGLLTSRMGFPELHSKVGRTGDNCFIRIAKNNVIHPVRVGLDLIAKGGWRRSRRRIELAICPPLCNVDTKIP
jgi:hypothetical protein